MQAQATMLGLAGTEWSPAIACVFQHFACLDELRMMLQPDITPANNILWKPEGSQRIGGLEGEGMGKDPMPVRCPYCSHVYGIPRKLLVFPPGKESRSFRCPFCNEEMVIRKEQIKN